MFKEFRDLRRKPDRRRSLPDLLNFGFAEDEYTIVMKDGARLVAFECQGPDLNSASSEELDAHRALANRAFLRLDEGFAYQVDQIRYQSAPRPKRVLADPVSSMIGHEGGAPLRPGGTPPREPDRDHHCLAATVGHAQQGRAGVRFRQAGRERS